MKINRVFINVIIAFLASGTLIFQGFTKDSPTKSPVKYKPLEEYLKSYKVATMVKSLGGHQKECVSIKFNNLITDTLFISLEPGRRLVSDDTSQQDIFIVKESTLILPPLASGEVNGYGFCCQSNKKSPPGKAVYNIGFMAPHDWVRLAKFINEHDFPASAVQYAVWVISNDHPIGSIYDEGNEDIWMLKEMVANIKGCEIPWYTVKYEKDTSMLFSGRPEQFNGTIKYYLKNNAVITITLRDDKGMLIKTIVKGSPTGAGYHDYFVDLNVKNWPNGTYHVYVHEDYSNLNIKKTFVL